MPLISCVLPSGLAIPTLEAVEEEEYTLAWDLPLSDGGCPITGYVIYSDFGTGGLIN